ncbi:prolipoprotein diacylglyceryl transferase [Loktanella sp. IMCC34160]|uniref:prolipoprotein diacylglyceryl transferase n=1 Tax=Loktanella sp. IMCC34160 TaxID=2510646 RepID=UPI00101CF089|nr:prolipoprotein diacylglyceryl transferase [Loktanella sp. IMCC34160]RYG90681.1 prolipoprotein diacylglyceryl transferase [Loktanella sp. IMCC34160]
MQAALSFPDISPEIFSITLFGMEFALRWYALGYIAGIAIGWGLIRWLIGRVGLWPENQPPMSREDLENLATWIVVGVILGGRIGYVLFYSQGAYLSDPLAILRVWEGGMSFHGGFLGVVAAVFFFARRHGLPLGSTADVIAVAAPPGIFLVRVANFINAELWGRPTDLPWGVVFPGEAAQDCGPDILLLCARHPSQLYEAGLEGLLLGLILIVVALRGGFKRPWLVSGLFFAGYGLSRFMVEFVRQPDAQFVTPGNPLGLYLHLDGYGLTAGQLLSLPMILIGLWVILRSRRRA